MSKSTLEQISELQEQAQECMREAEEKRNKILEQIRDLADQELSGSSKKKADKTPAKKAISSLPAKKKGTPKTSKPSGRGKKAEGELSLKGAICKVLEGKTEGLKVQEIREAIEAHNLWSSKGGDINTQLSQNIYGLKQAGKLKRNEETKAYTLV